MPPQIYDLLVIDLDGDGVKQDVTIGSQVYFDIDNDGIAEAVSWVNGNDGILARDLNNNGKIDDATEVFGNTTTNGFDAFRTLDTNNDGQITAADAAFSMLKIWKDTNHNGITDTGELSPLTQSNIVSITVSNYTATNGDKGVSHIGTATTTSGQIIEVANYNVSVDQRNSAYTKDYNLDLRALFLPTLKGHGNVANENRISEMSEHFLSRFCKKRCA